MPTWVARIITKTAKRKTVTTTVVSPMPISAIKIGTSAEIGALTKTLTHMPRILFKLGILAMSTPMGIPRKSASIIPRAKERSEIAAAAPNFAVGRIVTPAAITPENGGTMLDHLARPTISQTTNQSASEKMIGTRLLKRIINELGNRSRGTVERWVPEHPIFHYSSIPFRHHTYRFKVCHISSTVSK